MNESNESAELLSAIQSGEEKAFEKLVYENSKHLFAVASRLLGNEEDARDALQDTFLAAYQSVRRFRGESRLSTWLHRIVVNAALVRLRRRRRKPEESLEDLPPRWEEGGGRAQRMLMKRFESADRVLARRDVRAHVKRSIHRLPANYRKVLLLRDIEELGVEETAKALGTTPNAAKIRLHRARKALRTVLDQELAAQDRTVEARESRSK